MTKASSSESLPPLQRSIVVPLSVADAFDLFVRRLPEWWPLSTRSVWLEDAASCHVEPRVGGRLFERSRAGEESDWGRFRLFDEPTRVVFSWHPGQPDSSATEVDVTFRALEGAANVTTVSLEHRDWERLGERASFVRGLFAGGWGGVLARFEALANGKTELPPVVGPGCTDAAPTDGHAEDA